MSYSAIVIIFNPNSTGPSRSRAQTLAAALRQRSVGPVHLRATKRAGHAEELAEAAARQYDRPLIVAAGGDGSYHEVINGVMKAQVGGHPAVCAVLATGNANDHRSATAESPLLEAIVAEQISRLDLLCLETVAAGGARQVRYAHSYIGLGLTPVVAAELNRHSLNALRETAIVLRAYLGLRPFKIRRDGQDYAFDSLIFSNINRMAKILTLAADAEPDDGKFEVISFAKGHKLLLLARLLKAATVGLKPSARSADYEFEVVQTVPIQADGEVSELTAGTHVVARLAPQLLATIR